MKESTRGVVLSVLVSVATLVGTLIVLGNQFVTQAAFSEFKEGTIAAVIARLDRIEGKLDQIMQKGR